MINRSTKVLEGLGARKVSRAALAGLCTLILLASASLLRAGTGNVDMSPGWYVAGTNITAKAIPEQFSKFDGWGGDIGGATVSNKQITIDVTNAMNITATFSEKLTSSNAVPYRWLAAQDLSWTNDFESAVTNDHDKDGFTTGAEYWCGTDPTNEMSYLHISEMLVESTDFRLRWHHAKISDMLPMVCIQASPSAKAGTWEPVATNQVTNGVNFWTDGLQQRGFYRLSVTNMP